MMQISRDARSRSVRIADLPREDSAEVEKLLRFNRRGRLIQRLRNGAGPLRECDADGNRTATVDSQGTRAESGHDDAGRVVAVDHPVFGLISYEHDAAGRRVGAVAGDTVQGWHYAEGARVRHAVTTADGVEETVIRRGADGGIAAILANGAETRFFFDAACQLERSLRGDAETSQWRYDLAGRLVAESS
jgi:YD repeat-containing protein